MLGNSSLWHALQLRRAALLRGGEASERYPMHQLRLTTLQTRDIGSPFSRLLVAAFGLVVVLAAIAVLLFIVVPVLGFILSAAVGGVILAVVGIVLMVPLILVAGTVAALVFRGSSKRAGS